VSSWCKEVSGFKIDFWPFHWEGWLLYPHTFLRISEAERVKAGGAEGRDGPNSVYTYE
jgi:hypothetical protein